MGFVSGGGIMSDLITRSQTLNAKLIQVTNHFPDFETIIFRYFFLLEPVSIFD